MFSDI